ncbi:hypothetical protein SLA2020_263990 [Shorea laevis]
MGLATPLILSHSISIPEKSNSSNSMSQEYHHDIFSFSNGFERLAVSHQEQQQHHHHPQAQQQHIAQQIHKDKLRLQGFKVPPPKLVRIHEEESGGLLLYETAGMLSEMFNLPHQGATAADLLEQPMAPNYHSSRPQPVVTNEWYKNRQGMVVGGGRPPPRAK